MECVKHQLGIISHLKVLYLRRLIQREQNQETLEVRENIMQSFAMEELKIMPTTRENNSCRDNQDKHIQ
jgi:hypothetical protein